MTRKDYLLIASWIRTLRVGIARHGDLVLRCTFDQFVDSVADDLKTDNPRFDRDRFLAAAAGQEEMAAAVEREEE